MIGRVGSLNFAPPPIASIDTASTTPVTQASNTARFQMRVKGVNKTKEFPFDLAAGKTNNALTKVNVSLLDTATWGSVLIHGQEAPLVGRVCMDQCMVDVSQIQQTRVGDEVVLIGRQGQAALTAEQVAQRLGTSNYEVVSAILARVPRVD